MSGSGTIKQLDMGTRWSAWFLGLTGALIWFAGTLLHGQLVLMPIIIIQELLDGGAGPGSFVASLETLLLFIAWAAAGPVLVAMGGAMRFFAGVLTGRKVAGGLVKRIALWEWLRYELCALGFAMMAGSVFGLMVLETSDHESVSALRPMLVFLGYLGGGLLCMKLSFACGGRSNRYMDEVRTEPNPGGPSRWEAEAGDRT